MTQDPKTHVDAIMRYAETFNLLHNHFREAVGNGPSVKIEYRAVMIADATSYQSEKDAKAYTDGLNTSLGEVSKDGFELDRVVPNGDNSSVMIFSRHVGGHRVKECPGCGTQVVCD